MDGDGGNTGTARGSAIKIRSSKDVKAGTRRKDAAPDFSPRTAAPNRSEPEVSLATVNQWEEKDARTLGPPGIDKDTFEFDRDLFSALDRMSILVNTEGNTIAERADRYRLEWFFKAKAT